jgi:dTDP-4-dehydrorhamnose 3,5-epimerase-like enzyme
MKKIKVKNSGIIEIQSFDNFPDGYLAIGEARKNIPFNIKRFYFIKNLFNKKTVRGKHAHHRLEQCIFCINGKFTLELDDGENKQNILMNNPRYGVILGHMLWHDMKKFSKDCIILVVASMYYNEKDYIRNYDEFKQLAKAVK